MSHFPAIHLMTSHSFGESVGWYVKWCHMSRITIPLARKRPFHWISSKSGLVRAARESSKFQNWSLISNICRLYMAEILPILLKKRPMGYIAHLRKQLKSISTYNFTVTLIKRKRKKTLNLWEFIGSSFEETWIPFTQGCFVPRLCEIGKVVLEKRIFKFCQCIFTFS